MCIEGARNAFTYIHFPSEFVNVIFKYVKIVNQDVDRYLDYHLLFRFSDNRGVVILPRILGRERRNSQDFQFCTGKFPIN